MFPILITPSFTTGPEEIGFTVEALRADFSIDTGMISGAGGTTIPTGEGIEGAVTTAAGIAGGTTGGTTITAGAEGAANVTAAITTGGVGCITGAGGNAGVIGGDMGAGIDTGVGSFVGVGGDATTTTVSSFSFRTALGEGDLERGAFSVVMLFSIVILLG